MVAYEGGQEKKGKTLRQKDEEPESRRKILKGMFSSGFFPGGGQLRGEAENEMFR